ncbi:hypothetical protein IT084_13785 [Desulfallas sp. Bu1-1]|uniref:coiled-coil domain-containing protein n=1 Tax=Desulfallas sp. Bu1-1 TaxID=2787620 RepID=UPI00189C94B8|nr:hypothetical protein [Desulfallas sp. Bu1-1]MBF7084038.1 hypothetical protein [Desulfallas sp. Bu1-1]
MAHPRKQPASLILLLVFVFVLGSGPLICARDAPAYQDREHLQAREKEILAELITLNLRIDAAAREKQQLERKLEENLRRAKQAGQELARAEKKLKEQRRKLGPVISFAYRFGFTGFIGALVSAGDFSDLLYRSFLLSILVERYAKIISDAVALKNQKESCLNNLNRIKESIIADRAKIAATLARLQNAKAERTQFLAGLRKQSADLEARLTLMADRWSEVNSTIVSALELLSSLPPDAFRPDRVNLGLQGLQVELSETTINSAISKTKNKFTGTVSIGIKPGETTISGKTLHTGTPFAVKGDFQIAPEGREIIFVPGSFVVDDYTLEGDVLNYISTSNHLSWDIAKNLSQFKVTRLVTGDGKMIISLKSI